MWSLLLILSVYIDVLFYFGECAHTNDGIAVRALPMIYTTECQSVTGKWCLNDCIDGLCSVDIYVVEECHRCHNPAPTYYTTGQEYTDQHKCTSRCTKLSGDERPRCYVDYDWNKLDFCNPAFTNSFEYRDYTVANGPCANDCRNTSTSTYSMGDCNDISGTLRECYIDKYLYESVKTLSGHTCNGQCLRHDGTSYSWCYYDASNWDYCARPAIYKTACHNGSSIPIHLRQDETVSKYAQRMERDPRYRTVLDSDPNNPIYSYTYNETQNPNGEDVRLPLVIRARVYRSHIQPSNSRGSNAISSDSRANCRRMGMTGTDAVGHLISWKMGGPSDFINFVPMTRAINIGSVSGGSVYAPSVWAATERENAEFVEHEDGQVTIVAVLRYNPNDPRFPNRPNRIGWGQWDRAANGDVMLSCTNYWYNNECDAEDPDCI